MDPQGFFVLMFLYSPVLKDTPREVQAPGVVE